MDLTRYAKAFELDIGGNKIDIGKKRGRKSKRSSEERGGDNRHKSESKPRKVAKREPRPSGSVKRSKITT